MASFYEEFLQRINTKRLVKGAALLVLIAFNSPVFALALAPVYGSAPTHLFHGYGVAISAAAGWFLKDQVQRLSGRRAVFALPVLALWFPTIEYFLLQQSSAFGNPTGPIITALFSYYPLVFLTVACAGKLVQSGLNLGQNSEISSEHIPLLATYVIYSAGEHFAKAFIARCIGSISLFSTAGLQFLTTALYATVIPSRLLLLGLPSVLFSLTSNVHLPLGYTTTAANVALGEEGYALLARQDSLTGHVSVLENLDDGFRVMRCDHSLLGGQWTKMPRNYAPAVHDPIYAVFTMLEAIRLVETDHGEPRVDANSKALVIGLGVGTTPAALIKHGIETTIVEIDPVVHKFATEYFHLPSNHIAAIEDATSFVMRPPSPESAQYDYIVHDVFTGGAEPAELFTIEFLRGLNSLLKPDGVIAINWAGDISLYPAALTVRTVQAVFPTCRIFREEAAPKDNEQFTNMVIFCKKNAATPLMFRDPVPADFLGSKSRETYLVPKHELDAARFANIQYQGRPVLVAKEVGRLHKYQDRSALEHWKIMRQVLPAAVWENW